MVTSKKNKNAVVPPQREYRNTLDQKEVRRGCISYSAAQGGLHMNGYSLDLTKQSALEMVLEN